MKIPGHLTPRTADSARPTLDMASLAAGKLSQEQLDLVRTRLIDPASLAMETQSAQPAKVVFSGDPRQAVVQDLAKQLGISLGDIKSLPENSRFILLMTAGKLLPATVEGNIEPGQLLKLLIDNKGQISLQSATPKSTVESQLSNPDNQVAGRLSQTQLNTLLQALGQGSSQQINLQTGLATLTQLIADPAAATISSAVMKIVKPLLAELTASFTFPGLEPDSGVTENPSNSRLYPALDRTGASPVAAGVATSADSRSTLVKNWMQQSGLFFENRLLNTPSNGMTGATTNPKKSEATLQLLRQALLLQQAPPATGNQAAAISQGQPVQGNVSSPDTEIAQIQQMIRALQAGKQETTTKTQGADSADLQISGDLKAILQRHLISLSQTLPAGSDKPANIPGWPPATLFESSFMFPANAQSSGLHSLLADGEELTVGKLLRLLSGMLHRLQFDQLNSLYQTHARAADTPTTQSWFMEIPLATSQGQLHLAQLRIDREPDEHHKAQENNQQKSIQWNIVLTFAFEQTGPMTLQVKLAPPRVSSVLWAQKPQTLQLLNREASAFRKHLAELGLEVGEVQCLKGQPKLPQARLDQQLVDTQV